MNDSKTISLFKEKDKIDNKKYCNGTYIYRVQTAQVMGGGGWRGVGIGVGWSGAGVGCRKISEEFLGISQKFPRIVGDGRYGTFKMIQCTVHCTTTKKCWYAYTLAMDTRPTPK